MFCASLPPIPPTVTPTFCVYYSMQFCTAILGFVIFKRSISLFVKFIFRSDLLRTNFSMIGQCENCATANQTSKAILNTLPKWPEGGTYAL